LYDNITFLSARAATPNGPVEESEVQIFFFNLCNDQPGLRYFAAAKK
jgi:hypothetical protein